MTAQLLVMPGSPALIAALAPRDEAGQRLRALAQRSAEKYAGMPIHLVGSRDKRWFTAHAGSLRAWGAPQERVSEGHYLPELVMRHVLGPRANVVQVRDRIHAPEEGVLTVVAVDGSAGLTPRAPLSLIDAASQADQWCRDLLAGRLEGGEPDPDLASWLGGAGVIEQELWCELAALRPTRAHLVDVDATAGVGRYVAEWEWEA
ncbi:MULTISPECIES: hypothetical protein [unclassified Corynebacterium]|uniref:hypothetical protein n=1 Tax=unclassified Corynebacterium TaxID=2624378 RepID=UPI0029CA158A|nr:MULTISPECIES: hypothetical protein [unclassified Corynebacterium]WPF65263.1 hypothetical protein OLX12_06640 [Corynebacterium sp. 22KM0430]WPF67758.1 hypothetical protein OLW90_06630 [Corynebacterium sp. 21KM1197]